MDLTTQPKLNGQGRSPLSQALGAGTHDLLVLGGGITGAGIALDAVSRGLTVALVEKGDFASGTSSKSTKLVHGGLRYLKNMEVGLVREVGQERETVYRNAPHLVRPDRMLLPVVEGGSYGMTALGTALWTYDRLAGVREEERRVMLSAAEALQVEPLLNPRLLRGAGLYTEYQTDDARLTLAVMRRAASLGAVCLNHAEAVAFLYDDSGRRIMGAEVRDRITGQTVQVKASVVVNATGPWVDELRLRQEPTPQGKIIHSKGIHVVVRASDLPLRQAAYFDVGDGRMVFAIPVREVVYIGTTDSHYARSLEEIPVLSQEVDYLLAAANRMFPGAQLRPDKVVSTWAGVRPLIAQPGKATTEVSRKDEVFESAAGLVTIAGGKLTGYRKMAERVVDRVSEILISRNLKQRVSGCRTADIPLMGGEIIRPLEEMPAWAQEISKAHGLEMQDAWWLVKRFGSEAGQVAALLPPAGPGVDRVIMAALEWGLRQEAVATPGDFLVRRTGLLYFEPWRVSAVEEAVLRRMREALGWDSQMHQKMLQRWEAEKGMAFQAISNQV